MGTPTFEKMPDRETAPSSGPTTGTASPTGSAPAADHSVNLPMTSGHGDHHSPHHIHEFGAIDRIVHVRRDSDASRAEHHEPVTPISDKTRLARQQRWKRLRRDLWRPRHLMQYFYDDTLFRTPDLRKISREELFLDLVIVAAIAALGHELRALTPIKWEYVEKFILLFSAIYLAWRQIVFLWNLWGVKEDVKEKIGIYISFTAITGVALGAHAAFEPNVRPYVAISAFVASAMPLFGFTYWGFRERLLRNPVNKFNQLVFNSFFSIWPIIPFFIAAFVSSIPVVRALYWTSLGLGLANGYVPFFIYSRLHRGISNYTRLAVNIELFTEKFEVLTLIVLGESVIGILFEAGEVIAKDGVRVGILYLSAIGSTAMLHALYTFYVQIDSTIPKGGRHAIRHNSWAGITWATLHMPYHLCLILFATGLSISLRDIAMPPKATSEVDRLVVSALDVLVRADKEPTPGEEKFGNPARWIYAVGWAGSLIASGIIGILHEGGPRDTTKRPRVAVRSAVAIAVMVGMPFADVSAGRFQAVFVGVSLAMVVVEFTLMRMDCIGFFRSEQSPQPSTDSGGRTPGDVDYLEEKGSLNTSTDKDLDIGEGVLEGPNLCPGICAELKARMCKSHDTQLVAVQMKKPAMCKRGRSETEKK